MQIVIDIPKEFEEHFKVDRFEDSLARIESDIESFGLLAGRYEQETITMLREAINNGTILPKGHGKLKDENEIKQMIEDAKVKNDFSKTFAENIIKFASTIIEADKESDE